MTINLTEERKARERGWDKKDSSMKISEVIAKLNEFKTKYGDILVYRCSEGYDISIDEEDFSYEPESISKSDVTYETPTWLIPEHVVIGRF
jgi:hypothetical protein